MKNFRKPQPMCDFCLHRWKCIVECNRAVKERKEDRKKIKLAKEKHFTPGVPRSKTKSKAGFVDLLRNSWSDLSKTDFTGALSSNSNLLSG